MDKLAAKKQLIEKLAEMYYRGMPGSTQVLAPGQQARPGYAATEVSESVARPTVPVRPQLQLPQPSYAADYSKLNWQERSALKGQDPEWQKKMNSWWSGRQQRMAKAAPAPVPGPVDIQGSMANMRGEAGPRPQLVMPKQVPTAPVETRPMLSAKAAPINIGATQMRTPQLFAGR